MKDFRPTYMVFGLFSAGAISLIIIFPHLLNESIVKTLSPLLMIIFWPLMTLLCWIIDDRIEKTRVEIKMTNIETNTPNQVMDRIKKALEMRKPSKAVILANLYALQANNSLSNFEFFDRIGETYQLNPKFFMLSIYPNIRRKFSKIYGDEGMRLTNKNILEKFCLDEGEQIIYELNGKIRQKVPKKHTIKVHGTIYVTNYRIIAHGNFEIHPYKSTGGVILALIFGFRAGENPKKAKIAHISSSGPCYGYQFPIKNLHGLIYPSDFNNHKLSYSAKQDNSRIIIFVSKKEDHGDKLFAILEKFQTRK